MEETVAVVLVFLKVYLCEAENVIVGSTEQLACQFQNGNQWEKWSDVSYIWETIYNGGRYSGSQSSTLTITNFQIEDSGNFRCKVDGTDLTGDHIELKQPEGKASISPHSRVQLFTLRTNQCKPSQQGTIIHIQAKPVQPLTTRYSYLHSSQACGNSHNKVQLCKPSQGTIIHIQAKPCKPSQQGTVIYIQAKPVLTLTTRILDANQVQTLSENDKYTISSSNSLDINSVNENDIDAYYCGDIDGNKGPEITLP
ncbi:unnamed protein product [Mytilus coruscus]|uniref:Ig-like domain-containing protein n=1 Tax=Mytilus coruscus TaxID=42192 RepID=A0A6J8B7K7_MYTCO|nr:unnamed protein product [Mytilus coruscus]